MIIRTIRLQEHFPARLVYQRAIKSPFSMMKYNESSFFSSIPAFNHLNNGYVRGYTPYFYGQTYGIVPSFWDPGIPIETNSLLWHHA